MIRLLGLFVIAACLVANTRCEDDLRPSDPYASINGDPIFIGELNFLLTSKLRARVPEQVNENVRRASASLIVRQHLAMLSLRDQGGQTLRQLLDRDWQSFVGEVKRQGLSVEDFSRRFRSDAISVRAARDWDAAWRAYLKSRMTDANLKRMFDANPERYTGARWNVSHLFLPIDRSDPNSKDIAVQRAESFAMMLDAVSDGEIEAKFAELAREESEGATAKEGGRIGWVSKSGDLPGLVMAAIRRTEENRVTKPVVTSRGVHLVLVHAKAAQDVTYEQLSDRSQLRRDATDRLFAELISRQKDPRVTWLVDSLRPPN